MKARFLLLCAACLLSPLLMASSCEDPDEPPIDCDQRVGADARGVWTLHARGKRRDCDDKELNGELVIDVPAFRVDGEPVASNDDSSGDTRFEADAFIERIRRAQYTLVAGPDAPSGLAFSGELNTCQVTFTMQEALPNGASHAYTFDGFVDSSFRIYGEFDGAGPDGCTSSGRFEVEIR